MNLAVGNLLKKRPELVVSGINRGANLGDDVTYSGTVAGAMEGAMLGIKSFAVSLASKQSEDFATAAEFAAQLAQIVAGEELAATDVPQRQRSSREGGGRSDYESSRAGRPGERREARRVSLAGLLLDQAGLQPPGAQRCFRHRRGAGESDLGLAASTSTSPITKLSTSSRPGASTGTAVRPAVVSPSFRSMVWIRRLYDWVLHWADTPYGAPALGVLSFAEFLLLPDSLPIRS